MQEVKEKEKEKELIVGVPAGTLDKIVDNLPQGILAKQDKLAKEFEDPYIMPKGYIIVFDVSTNALTTTDGIPGHLDIEFGDDRLKDTGLEENRQVTKQGLVKRYRFPVMINMLPTTDYKYEFNIVEISKWEEYSKDKGGSGMTNEQAVASFMLRSGGAT